MKKANPMTPQERGKLGAAARWVKKRSAAPSSTTAAPTKGRRRTRQALIARQETTTDEEEAAQRLNDLHFARLCGRIEAALIDHCAHVGVPLAVAAGRLVQWLSTAARR